MVFKLAKLSARSQLALSALRVDEPPLPGSDYDKAGGNLLSPAGTECYFLPLPPGLATVRERALVTKRLRLTPSLSALSTRAW